MIPPTDDELRTLSVTWAIPMHRLKFLLACPHHNHGSHVKPGDYTGREHEVAMGVWKALKGSWTPYEAALYCKGTEDEVNAFVKKNNIQWPEGCRRRLAWGGSTTHNHLREEQGMNLLATNKISIQQAVLLGSQANLTAGETADKYNLSRAGLYHAAKQLGVRFRKFHTPKGKTL